jgi:hypothetical protein
MDDIVADVTVGPATSTPERASVLARIEAYKRREIAEAKLRLPLAKLEKQGEAFLISAIRAGRPSAICRAMASAKPRGGSALATCFSSLASGRRSFASAISRRL